MKDYHSAVAATPPAQLLPARHSWAAPEGSAQLIDAFELTDGALCLVGFSDSPEVVVVPARIDGGRVIRTALAHAVLGAQSRDAFTIDVLADLPVTKVEQAIDVDQTNESVVLGDWVVKWQVRVHPTPALQRMRDIEMAVHTGLIPQEHISPDLLGSVEWTDSNGHTFPLLTATRYLPNSEDGWTWAVALVRAHATDGEEDVLTPFQRLGRMTALMHVAFAANASEQWSSSHVNGLAARMSEDLDDAVAVIDGEEGGRLRSRRDQLDATWAALGQIDRTPVIPIHGDLHVGQVLRSSNNALAIVDFDGNPVQTTAERMEPQPAARDVASMLASIDHVARVVIYRTPGVDSERVEAWIPQAQAAYLDSYQRTLADFGSEWIFDPRLVQPFQVHQEVREYLYSAHHLPHWRYVPDAVLTAMFPDQEM